MNKSLVFAGGVAASTLYLAGCIVAGLVVGSPVAWKGGLVAVGITYLSYLAEAGDCHRLAVGLMALSIAAGVLAGLVLLPV